MIMRQQLEDIFTYHAPDKTTSEGQKQLVAYAEIRAKALELAETIIDLTPVCADQQDALRKVREAVMTANAAVALQGLV
jgi:hypothetical protein